MAAKNPAGNFPSPDQYGESGSGATPGAAPQGTKHGFEFVNHDDQFAPPPIWGSGSVANAAPQGQPMQDAADSKMSKGRNVK